MPNQSVTPSSFKRHRLTYRIQKLLHDVLTIGRRILLAEEGIPGTLFASSLFYSSDALR